MKAQIWQKVHLLIQYHTVVFSYQGAENGEVLIGLSSRPGLAQVTSL